MATESPHILLTLVAFLALIGSLVVVHELGHYAVGRWFGVKAEKFSIGFGPQIWGRVDKRGTLWRIGLLPLGGYVQFAGDMNPASQADETRLDCVCRTCGEFHPRYPYSDGFLVGIWEISDTASGGCCAAQ